MVDSEKRLRIGIREGGGSPPGYQWTVVYLSKARDEATRILNKSHYLHMVDQFRALAMEGDPTHPVTASVDAIEDFFELRDKGGPLGRINLRVFFIVEKEARRMVILGVIKKENEGQTPPATKQVMRTRRRKYLQGDYGRR